MDYALALAADCVRMPHAWIAVITPGLMSLLAIVLLRRTWSSSRTVWLFAAGTAITWLTTRWTETPEHLGLHLQPATFLLLLFAWRERIVQAPSWKEASKWAASLAGMTWLSLVIVDVGACLAHPVCLPTAVGGEGLTDMLVLGPTLAFGAVILVWAAQRPKSNNLNLEAK